MANKIPGHALERVLCIAALSAGRRARARSSIHAMLMGMQRENRDPPEAGETSNGVSEPGGLPYVEGEGAERKQPNAGSEDVSPEELINAAVPREDDWTFRPYSASERYTDPDTEIGFAEAMTVARTNYPAIVGLVLAVLGIVPGIAGLVLALGGIALSILGLWTASRGAKRRSWAAAGVVIGLGFALAHWLLPY